MGIVYYLYIITFLVFPIVGIVGAKRLLSDRITGVMKLLIGLFLTHNVLFVLKYSLIGDLVDYIIFSLEFLMICILIPVLNKGKDHLSMLGSIGAQFIVGLGVLQGLVGILLFIFVSQDYVVDETHRFETSFNTYEIRVYSFGGVTLMDTRFTYETYKLNGFLPIEKKMDVTVLWKFKGDVKVDANLEIFLLDSNNHDYLEFKNGSQVLTKELN